ncbi:hypothetical protein DVH24_024929 [Malus domestica]|uniref:Uncharacterized protein n=1 Tax=Malus domestica TaxID=3750 RepID=A0A498JJQ5_MALDO|nr:hypothetical protein DVH24_024929 [Malus domestica]
MDAVCQPHHGLILDLGFSFGRNITFLNEHCPLDTSDSALPPLNFGIFLDSLKNHNSKHIKFRKKLFYTFWWGLRNLSNFGTNLTCVGKLVCNSHFCRWFLLFLYLIGNVQTFMQMQTTKTEERRQKAVEGEETRRKNRLKMLDVVKWIYENRSFTHENNFPDDMKNEITNSIEETLNKDKDTDVHKPFLILPWQTQKSIKRFLFMKTLGTVCSSKLDLSPSINCIHLHCNVVLMMYVCVRAHVYR